MLGLTSLIPRSPRLPCPHRLPRGLLVASFVASFVALSVVACGAASAPNAPARAPEPTTGPSSPPATKNPSATSPTTTTTTTTATGAPSHEPPDAAAIYARLESGLVRCYELGKKTTPEMTDGKLTLNASIDTTGKTTCVIPSDHTGLTQDVEDCMSARFTAEKFDAGPAWSAALPIVLRGGKLARGESAPDTAVIESVETIRMPDAFEAVEALEPALQACIRKNDAASGAHGLLVGARVGADGRTQCALATSTGALPAGVGECASGVLRGAKFPPPKRGSGIVLVPINVVGGK